MYIPLQLETNGNEIIANHFLAVNSLFFYKYAENSHMFYKYKSNIETKNVAQVIKKKLINFFLLQQQNLNGYRVGRLAVFDDFWWYNVVFNTQRYLLTLFPLKINVEFVLLKNPFEIHSEIILMIIFFDSAVKVVESFWSTEITSVSPKLVDWTEKKKQHRYGSKYFDSTKIQLRFDQDELTFPAPKEEQKQKRFQNQSSK